MESAIENETDHSINAAWRHFKQIWMASSAAEAWQSFKQMMRVLPMWAIVVGIVLACALMTNAWLVLGPLVLGSVLAAIYFTVKHAVRAALREHESQRRL